MSAAATLAAQWPTRVIDFNKPLPIWYWILMILLAISLFRIVLTGLNRNVAMSRSSRIIRVVGAGLWLLMILFGMTFQLLKGLR